MYAGTVDMMRLRYPRRRAGWWALARRIAVGTAAAGVLFLGLAHAAQGSPASTYETVTVRPGDTLWAIAAERYPNADVRQKVDEIERGNGLSDPVIHPGQTLKVPTT